MLGHVAIVAVAAGTVAIGYLTPLPDTSAAVDVSLGLFATLLTALTIVLVLTVDVDSKWPSLLDVVGASFVVPWFVVAVGAVILAATAGGPSASAALLVALLGALLGVGSVALVLWKASGPGRRRFLSSVLRRRLLRDHVAARSERSDIHGADAATGLALDPFRRVVDAMLDADDAVRLGDRVDEALIATSALEGEERLSGLNLLLWLLDRLGRAALRGKVTNPVVGDLLTRVGLAIVTRSGEMVRESRDEGRASRDGVAAERIGAVYLGQVSRLMAWQAHTAHELAPDGTSMRPVSRVLIDAALSVREAVAAAVDPGPPRGAPPASEAWEGGLSDPLAVLLWQWGWVEYNPTHLGRDMYVLVEVLTRERFFGSFGWGNGCPLTEAMDRLDRGDRADDGELRAARRHASDVLLQVGGLPDASLELFATFLATWRARAWMPPPGLAGNAAYSTEPFRAARAVRLFTLRRPEHRFRSADEAIDALAALSSHVGRDTCLWNEVADAYGRVPGVAPPLASPADRPAACVLAVAARIAPLERASAGREAAREEVRRYFDLLPSRLRDAALRLADEIFAAEAHGSAAAPMVDRLTAHLDVLLEDDQAEVVA